MSAITIVVVGALIVSLILTALRKVYDWLCSFFKARDVNSIPEPARYPILRHLPYFLDNFEDDKKLRRWSEIFKKEGIFKFDILLGPERICVFKEEYIKQICVKNYTRFHRTELIGTIFPNMKGGLFLSNGEEHSWQRRMLHPVFSLASVQEFTGVFDSITENLIKYWREKTKNSMSAVAEVNIHKDFSKLTLDVIGVTAFGYKFNTLVSGVSEVSEAVELILKGKLSVMARFLKRIIPFYDKIPFQQNAKLQRAAIITNDIVSEIIKQKREILKTQKDHHEDVTKDLLGKMLILQDEETGRKLSDEMIHAQVHTFIVAGHETTSVALTWIFYLLAKHPAIQEKAREEANVVLDGSEEFKKEHLDKLEYITAVINESLRMYPPAAVFMREVKQDDQLGNYKIPKGAYIIIPVCVVHHMEENWPNHDQFIPERFLGQEDNAREIGNYKFMPFSNGPRNCIGRRFAMNEMKVAVTKLLTKFKFELDPKQQKIGTQLRLTLKPNPQPILRVSLLE